MSFALCILVHHIPTCYCIQAARKSSFYMMDRDAVVALDHGEAPALWLTSYDRRIFVWDVICSCILLFLNLRIAIYEAEPLSKKSISKIKPCRKKPY